MRSDVRPMQPGRGASGDPTAFYARGSDGTFAAGTATESPWGDNLQHGGPPAALLVQMIVDRHPRDDMRIARVSAEFLGPIPIGTMHVRTHVRRPGRRIEMLDGVLECAGREVVLARVWRIAVSPNETVPPASVAPDPVPALATAGAAPQWITRFGYGRAIEWRAVFGGDTPGPAAVWARPRIDLIAGEPTSAVAKALLIADSANGISAELAGSDWLFVPPSLCVALERYPIGDWILLSAQTTLSRDGVGVTTHRLADESAYFASGIQPLLVERRR